MPYSVSTHHNPFCQGGWKSCAVLEQSSLDSPTAVSGPAACTSVGVPDSPSTATPDTLAPPSSTTFRMIPSSSANDEHAKFVLLSANSRILYTITSRGPTLMLVKDSRGRSTALIESSATPCVEIRGSTGKKRIDEWLMHDSANPCLRFMHWGEECYYWSIADDNTNLYRWSDREFQLLAEVRPWGSLFEIEMTSLALKKSLLEPSLVALMIMRRA
ncbi:hypothetical protein PILCRDRAFT_810200 [Piloderma croceum F 1598]|uniref:Uncharacterized protein n=1 Tax=Piloderma croceum (strain F 1598) TaxID=765440 RepID=A0A0C3C049_PILCF|nr:hypothetical protein PILCRDRAFT_810200 [Piloderma croceum F 1598]